MGGRKHPCAKEDSKGYGAKWARSPLEKENRGASGADSPLAATRGHECFRLPPECRSLTAFRHIHQGHTTEAGVRQAHPNVRVPGGSFNKNKEDEHGKQKFSACRFSRAGRDMPVMRILI